MTKKSDIQTLPSQSGFVVFVMLATSLTVGFFDATLAILAVTPMVFGWLHHVVGGIAVIAGVVFVIQVLAYLLGVPTVGRVLGLEPRVFALSLTVFVGSFACLAVLMPLAVPLPEVGVRYGFVHLARWLFMLLLPLLAAWLLQPVLRERIVRSDFLERVKALGLAVPWLTAGAFALLWLYAYRGASALMAAAGFVVVSALSVLAARRLAAHSGASRWLITVTVVILLIPALLGVAGVRRATGLATSDTNRPVKRVILLSVDTLRPDALSCYDPDGPETPRIDELAQDSLTFTDAVSPAPWTLPAFASIMTGLPVRVHNTDHPRKRLPDALHTLAEHLAESGYYTGAIGYNPLLLPKFNISQGFENYRFFSGFIGSSTIQVGATPIRSSTSATLSCWLLARFSPYVMRDHTTDLTDMASAWVEEHAEENFFLWLHYYDPHLPYSPPEAFLPPDADVPPAIGQNFDGLQAIRSGFLSPTMRERAWIRELYDAEVRHVDAAVGRFLDKLRELDLYDDSLIVFLSDHGEEFWEHGGFEHGHSVYQELIHVPLFIKLPQSAKVGRVETPVSTQAVMSTILELCEIDHDPSFLTPSLSALWRGNDAPLGDAPVFSSGTIYYGPRSAVLFGPMKYLRDEITGRQRLFNLRADPAERTSLAASMPAEVQLGKSMLEENARQAMETRKRLDSPALDEDEFQLDQETVEQLKSLGYIN